MVATLLISMERVRVYLLRFPHTVGYFSLILTQYNMSYFIVCSHLILTPVMDRLFFIMSCNVNPLKGKRGFCIKMTVVVKNSGTN